MLPCIPERVKKILSDKRGFASASGGNRYDENIQMANLNPRITVEPGKMGGKPCIRGLRFTVYDLASYLAAGMSEDDILRDFPYLEKEDFQAVYEFFASIPERISVLEATC
jgi:uncharacterized protein (DUF433 family)